MICYFSQYDKETANLLIKDDEQADFYLGKPVPEKDLRNLFKLLNITTGKWQDDLSTDNNYVFDDFEY